MAFVVVLLSSSGLVVQSNYFYFFLYGLICVIFPELWVLVETQTAQELKDFFSPSLAIIFHYALMGTNMATYVRMSFLELSFSSYASS